MSNRSHYNRQPLQPAYGFVHLRSELVLFSFSSVVFSATEGNTATITVTRTGTAAASVNYATANGTATASTDYTASSGTLAWAEGETGAKTFAVSTIENADDGETKTVLLALSAPIGGQLGEIRNAVLLIADDDAASGGGGDPEPEPEPGYCDGALFCDTFTGPGTVPLIDHLADVGGAYLPHATLSGVDPNEKLSVSGGYLNHLTTADDELADLAVVTTSVSIPVGARLEFEIKFQIPSLPAGQESDDYLYLFDGNNPLSNDYLFFVNGYIYEGQGTQLYIQLYGFGETANIDVTAGETYTVVVIIEPVEPLSSMRVFDSSGTELAVVRDDYVATSILDYGGLVGIKMDSYNPNPGLKIDSIRIRELPPYTPPVFTEILLDTFTSDRNESLATHIPEAGGQWRRPGDLGGFAPPLFWVESGSGYVEPSPAEPIAQPHVYLSDTATPRFGIYLEADIAFRSLAELPADGTSYADAVYIHKSRFRGQLGGDSRGIFQVNRNSETTYQVSAINQNFGPNSMIVDVADWPLGTYKTLRAEFEESETRYYFDGVLFYTGTTPLDGTDPIGFDWPLRIEFFLVDTLVVAQAPYARIGRVAIDLL